MINLLLIRYEKMPTYTEGVLFEKDKTGGVHHKKLCHTLEDKIIDVNGNGKIDSGEIKVYGESAIPYGTYNIEATYSPHFKKRMVLIKDVDGFEGIRMHGGASVNNSDGCVLCGEKISDGRLKNIGMTDKLVKLLDANENKGTIEII